MSSVVLGVPLEDLSLDSTFDLIEALIRDGRASGRTHQIATVNVDFVVNALSDPALMQILRDSSVNLADGMPLLWASKWMGTPLTERVAGSDLFAGLGRESSERGWDVHVFGGSPDVARRAEALIASEFPDARFTVDPGPKLDDVDNVPDEVIDGLTRRNPDLLCVALGNPKQEHFIRNHARRLGTPVMIGVGGSMDMLVGDRRRASGRVQRAGLEWIARAMQEPARLGPRYARDGAVFIPKVVREQAFRRRTGAPGCSFDVTVDGSRHVAVPRGTSQAEATRVNGAIDDLVVGPVVIHLDGVDELSWAGVATLCRLVRHARRYGQDITVTSFSNTLRVSLINHAIGEWLVTALTAGRSGTRP